MFANSMPDQPFLDTACPSCGWVIGVPFGREAPGALCHACDVEQLRRIALAAIVQTQGVLGAETVDAASLDDPPTYQLLGGDSIDGIFMTAIPEFRSILRGLRPERFSDAVVAVVLCRPGILGSGIADEVVARRQGGESMPRLHPFVDGVLGDTYGVVLFRHQFDAIVAELAGDDAEAASLLFHGLTRGEGDWTVLSDEFVASATGNGHAHEAAEAVFQRLLRDALWTFGERDVIEQDAGLVVQSAYLRAHHPAEFAAALALVAAAPA